MAISMAITVEIPMEIYRIIITVILLNFTLREPE